MLFLILPEGYKLTSLPLDISISKPFGSFSAKIVLNNGQISYERKLQVKEGTYPRELYPDVVDFYQQVEDTDSYNVALSRQ